MVGAHLFGAAGGCGSSTPPPSTSPFGIRELWARTWKRGIGFLRITARSYGTAPGCLGLITGLRRKRNILTARMTGDSSDRSSRLSVGRRLRPTRERERACDRDTWRQRRHCLQEGDRRGADKTWPSRPATGRRRRGWPARELPGGLTTKPRRARGLNLDVRTDTRASRFPCRPSRWPAQPSEAANPSTSLTMFPARTSSTKTRSSMVSRRLRGRDGRRITEPEVKIVDVIWKTEFTYQTATPLRGCVQIRWSVRRRKKVNVDGLFNRTGTRPETSSKSATGTRFSPQSGTIRISRMRSRQSAASERMTLRKPMAVQTSGRRACGIARQEAPCGIVREGTAPRGCTLRGYRVLFDAHGAQKSPLAGPSKRGSSGSKTVMRREAHRGFESPPLRHFQALSGRRLGPSRNSWRSLRLATRQAGQTSGDQGGHDEPATRGGASHHGVRDARRLARGSTCTTRIARRLAADREERLGAPDRSYAEALEGRSATAGSTARSGATTTAAGCRSSLGAAPGACGRSSTANGRRSSSRAARCARRVSPRWSAPRRTGAGPTRTTRRARRRARRSSGRPGGAPRGEGLLRDAEQRQPLRDHLAAQTAKRPRHAAAPAAVHRDAGAAREAASVTVS